MARFFYMCQQPMQAFKEHNKNIYLWWCILFLIYTENNQAYYINLVLFLICEIKFWIHMQQKKKSKKSSHHYSVHSNI